MKILKRHRLIVILVTLAVAVIAAFQLKGNDNPQYFTAKVDRGDISQVVDATGTINAVTTVQVGSQVSGTVSRLYVDFNSRVKKGQVIAQIDPALFEGSLLQAKADLANARASVATAKANLQKALALQIQTTADYERAKALTAQRVMSTQQLDLAKSNYDSAIAGSSAADALVKQAQAQVQQREAAVRVAQTNLDYTTIRAPIDGTVIARNVDVGQTVAASLQAPTLFTIAQDLTKMQVYASTDESDVGSIRPNQLVTFKVDAYPKDSFSGLVSQVRMNATTVQNVVTYNTIIDFDNPEMKLFPGMTAYVTIPVASATDVLRVPNSALRYKPDMKAEEIRAIYQKFGLDNPRLPSAGNHTAATSGQEYVGGAVKKVNSRTSASQNEAIGLTPTVAYSPDGVVLWKLRPDKSLEPVRIRSGITDHTVTEVAEVVNGSLNSNEDLVTGAVLTAPKIGPGTTAANRH
ncbi:MAG: efflux RND transporter periplasmic adaptor subunit [Acidobacteriia bacterium]|nr:efflux RND transporter periplasmic adaptor subunit [Terriglobia bacterium]